MDAELVFRLILIAIASVALVSIILHYNKCMQAPSAPSRGGAPVENYKSEEDDETRSDQINPPDPSSRRFQAEGGQPNATEEFVDDLQAPVEAAGGYGGPIQSQDLLPKLTPEAQQFAQLYPCGQGDLSGMNFLESGTLVGQSTNLKRNANLQLRSDPPIPYKNVSPWQMSTIRPDCYQRTFELGQA